MVEEQRRYSRWDLICCILFGIFFVVMFILQVYGCTTFKTEVPVGDKMVPVEYRYFLQNKNWKITNGDFSVEFGSSNDPLEKAIDTIAVLGGGVK